MALRHCNSCEQWHDLSEPWPEACASHFEKAKFVRPDPEKRSTIFDDVHVTRGHWREDRETHEMITLEEWEAKYGKTGGITIIKDLDPYMSVNKEYIGGRKQHRDMLRAHNAVEVGNEVVKKKYEAPPDLKGDIRRALQQTGWDGKNLK